MTDFVTYHGDFEDAYRRSDGDEVGYPVPVELIERRETAEKALDEANEAIRRYIEANNVTEIELRDLDEESR